MGFIEKRTARSIFSILGSILIFIGLANTPFMIEYYKQYPYIVLGTGVLIIIFLDKLSSLVSGEN